ncbi:MAG TPA: ester cyclase [Stellaceae bacterium]|nr:ester cyclase [Stellaceae bacterium]
MSARDPAALARWALAAFASGSTFDAESFIAPDYANLESADRSDARGADEFRATVAWFHRAFADLRYDEVALLADDTQAIAWVVLHGRHVHPFLGVPADGRTFAVEQVHLFRCAGGCLTGHRAVRDDLRLLLRLGARVVLPDGSPLAVHHRAAS